MSDWFETVARDLRAAIRRDAHRPWHRRAWHRHRRPLLVALIALVVAAPALAATGVLSGGTEVSSTSCSQSAGSGGGTRAQVCTITLSDGQRFSCRPAFALAQPDARAVERSRACTRLGALEQSRGTRAAATRLATVRSCLLDQGLAVSGGATPSAAQEARGAPAGELVVVNGAAPVFIGFYETDADARRQLHAAAEQARRHGGRAVRRGATIVSWSREPGRDLQQHVETCVVG
jgi:hypothetical protein